MLNRWSKLVALQAEHDRNCENLVAAGFTNTVNASVPFHSHVARPSTAEAQVVALVETGPITPADMWVACGAQAFNSGLVFQAQAGIKA